MSITDRVRVKNVSVLSDRHYRLNEVELEYRRSNGEWQIVQGLPIDEFSRERMDATLKELEEERAGVTSLL